jgi:hypothetical protein
MVNHYNAGTMLNRFEAFQAAKAYLGGRAESPLEQANSPGVARERARFIRYQAHLGGVLPLR